ncbi:hypothetical protein GobsT_16100 [Gemmata obscuriglobus]|uniref:Uncharacterized protein n=1 Tax=Gemmata obscuriglobus TaxID=114 RepID=A0A2Z3GZP5_9BACT|nr:hypothetical protein [Gemmata obscuriglobus]AWM39989.1 hypothetical protein C1280_25275 [Gemmata obscuriglobus]QEG26862.1 hypothetical protein GobsT_16100 [Gemmata obscuriglobus]VTS02877.1 unnamed protein product [Gemmata obscuriglobus UQM 2246]
MNTKSLSKHYATLSAAERLSLLMAAGARGDDVEHARVVAAAPWETWRVPDTFGRALAFLAVFGQHRMERLELAALFFKTSALADSATEPLATRLRDAARLYGYLVRVHGEAWDQFCAAEQLDPGVCETVAPGNATLEVADDEATACGFTDAEAREYVQRSGNAEHRLKTAQSLVAELSSALKFIINKL